MIKATQIKMVRAEGPIHLCREDIFTGADCWKRADAWLMGVSNTAPKDGCYDKCDFIVTFANGETYQGRIDVKHHSCGNGETVAGHIRQFINFHVGINKPAHRSPEHWKSWLNNPHRIEAAKDYAAFLAQYEVPAF